jgi:hypothetical protein
MLQGWNARGDGAQRLQAHYRSGTFAEQVLVPMENAVPIGPARANAAIDHAAASGGPFTMTVIAP